MCIAERDVGVRNGGATVPRPYGIAGTIGERRTADRSQRIEAGLECARYSVVHRDLPERPAFPGLRSQSVGDVQQGEIVRLSGDRRAHA